jgi:hypothetical protein
VRATLSIAGRPAREAVFKDAAPDSQLTVSTSPDAQWVVACPADTTTREWVLWPGLPRVDVLDAGAGSVDAAAAKLKTAGFVAAHTGKSQSAHAKTEIFYAVGFDADATQVAAALGVDAAAAKPVTWSTPFAITVALAKTAP